MDMEGSGIKGLNDGLFTERGTRLARNEKCSSFWKYVKAKDVWVSTINSRFETLSDLKDACFCAYLLYSHSMQMSVDSFAFRFLLMFCASVVIYDNIKCVWYSQKTDQRKPWRQFSRGSTNVLYFNVLNLTLREYGKNLSVITAMSAFFLDDALRGSAVWYTCIGCYNISTNFPLGWYLWNANEEMAKERKQILSLSLTSVQPINNSSSNNNFVLNSTLGEGKYTPKEVKTKAKTRGRQPVREDRMQREILPPVVIPEELGDILKTLKAAGSSNNLKTGDFNSYLNKAVKYREERKAVVVLTQENNKNKIKVTINGRDITFFYEPTHKQNGQNSTEYSGFKLQRALQVVQNLYLMDLPENVLNELDNQGLLIRRIKGLADFARFVLEHHD